MSPIHQFRIVKLVLSLLLLLAVLAMTSANAASTGKVKFTEMERVWLDAHPEVTIGIVEGLPPSFMIDDEGQASGFLVDYAALLSEQTGSHFKLEVGPDWTSMVDSARQRKVDVLGLATPQLEHRSDFHFTLPIIHTKTYIFGPLHANIPGHNLKGLSGKRVGYIKSFKYIENYFPKLPEINFVPVKTPGELISALDSGDIDYIIHTEWFEYLLRTQGVSNYKVHLDVPQLKTDAIMAVRSDWPELTPIINKVLAANQGTMRDTLERWLKFTKNVKIQNKGLQLTNEEQNWLTQHPTVRVGIDREWAPVEFIGKDKQAHGISIEYLKRLEEILGIKFELIDAPRWIDSYNAASRGDLDLLPSLSSTEERRKDLTFTAPYLSMPINIFSASDQAYISGLEALKNRPVVVVEGHAIQSMLKRDYPELKVLGKPTVPAALQEVAKGNAFAYIGDLVITSYYIGQSGLNQIKVIGETNYSNDIAMGVRKDWELFPTILQKALNAIPPNERDSIYNRWFSIQYNHHVDYRALWQWGAVMSALLLIILYWNRRLTKEIKQRKTVEDALLKANEDAEKATAAALKATKVKSQFLANMSHEIRTPMNSVISAGHLLQQTELTTKQHEYLNILSHAADALLKTIDGILDFSKGEAGKLQPESINFHIDDVLFNTKQIFKLDAAEKGLQLTINVGKNIPETLRGDSEKLGQILRNLVSNAIKFTDHGTIDISVELDSITPSRKKATLLFSVKDTGKGIEPEVQDRLFQPFTQADPTITRIHGGTGLGLTISQQLTTLMGGTISFESELNQGTSFSVRLPFDVVKDVPLMSNRTMLTTPDTPERLEPLPELFNVKVLLVEDNPLNLFLGKSFLELFGTQVKTANDGRQALSTLETEPVDIIFMDIQMPRMDGYQTTQAIRQNEKGQSIPIIALSAHVLAEEKEIALAAGMNDYLSKPFKPEQLREKLLKWAPTSER